MSGVTPIRRAGPADLEALAALEAGSNPHPWRREALAGELALPQSVTLVAEAPDGLRGLLVLWLVAGELQILEVLASAAHRRQGVGQALLRAALALGREAGAEVALLEVRAGNAPAIGLYEREGFARDGKRARYYADGEDALLMSRSLR
jgi:ribosomal-protein-alanine N-acetyltransferase